MPRTASFYALISIAAAIATIVMKGAAAWITGSVGLFSDAAESVVNLVAAVAALSAIRVAALPPDHNHAFGHSKAEYFSSAFEAGLILTAALAIGWTAVERLLNPHPIEQLGVGIVLAVAASIVNLAVALLLRRAAGRLRSIALRADSDHLLTDVWTSVGVVAGLALASWTGWTVLDPVLALLVAANIVWSGFRLLRATADGLMDLALPAADTVAIDRTLDRWRARGIVFHAVRTREAGHRKFVEMHVLAPGDWTIRQGHALCDELEGELCAAVPGAIVTTHLEPVDDPASYEDEALDHDHAPRSLGAEGGNPGL